MDKEVKKKKKKTWVVENLPSISQKRIFLIYTQHEEEEEEYSGIYEPRIRN
jgi:hypothetical protein